MQLRHLVVHVVVMEEEWVVMMDEINALNIENRSLANQLSTLEESGGIVGSSSHMKDIEPIKYGGVWDVKELNFLYHMEFY